MLNNNHENRVDLKAKALSNSMVEFGKYKLHRDTAKTLGWSTPEGQPDVERAKKALGDWVTIPGALGR